MDNDILYNAAKAYEQIMQYKYYLTLGNSKKKIIISILSSERHNFTHVSGLDHLTDIPKVYVNPKQAGIRSKKEMVFKRILKKEITFDTIDKSKFIDEPLGHNNKNKKTRDTNKPEISFTVRKRIEYLQNIQTYFDEAGRKNGELRKWNPDNSYSNINADYVLYIPIDENVSMFCFLVQTNKNDSKDKPIELTLISAFPDVKEFILGNQKYTILEEKRIDNKTSEEVLLFRHKLYSLIEEKEQSDKNTTDTSFPTTEENCHVSRKEIIEKDDEEFIPHKKR